MRRCTGIDRSLVRRACKFSKIPRGRTQRCCITEEAGRSVRQIKVTRILRRNRLVQNRCISRLEVKVYNEGYTVNNCNVKARINYAIVVSINVCAFGKRECRTYQSVSSRLVFSQSGERGNRNYRCSSWQNPILACFDIVNDRNRSVRTNGNATKIGDKENVTKAT